MAGGRLGDVNATRDGINVNEGRYENGAWSVVYSSPDAVEEVKIVVAPVDISALRHERDIRRGHHMLAHLRTEAYPVYNTHQYPPRKLGETNASPELSYELNNRLIDEAKKQAEGQTE